MGHSIVSLRVFLTSHNPPISFQDTDEANSDTPFKDKGVNPFWALSKSSCRMTTRDAAAVRGFLCTELRALGEEVELVIIEEDIVGVRDKVLCGKKDDRTVDEESVEVDRKEKDEDREKEGVWRSCRYLREALW